MTMGKWNDLQEQVKEEDNFKRAYTGSSWELETKGYQKQYTDLIEKINNSIRSVYWV